MEKIKSIGYAEIQNFSNEQWTDFRKNRWVEKQATYKDEKNVPEWFWPIQKEKNSDIRDKAWAKKCRAYNQSTGPAEWFMPKKEEYVEFLIKIEKRKQKFSERKNTK